MRLEADSLRNGIILFWKAAWSIKYTISERRDVQTPSSVALPKIYCRTTVLACRQRVVCNPNQTLAMEACGSCDAIKPGPSSIQSSPIAAAQVCCAARPCFVLILRCVRQHGTAHTLLPPVPAHALGAPTRRHRLALGACCVASRLVHR